MDRIKVERAIDGLTEWRKHVQTNSDIDRDISTAIEALKAQLSLEGTTSDQPVATDINVGNTISRSAAIKAVSSLCDDCDSGHCGSCHVNYPGEKDAIKVLKELPPTQPEQQEGHWILHESPDCGEQYECSECGVLWEFNDGTPGDNGAYYCPNCGARMKGVVE